MKLRSIFKTHPLAALIAAAFFTLALIYGIVTPPFEMSDESRHYAVVKYIADTGRLPVQQAGEAQRHWSHEGNQPPLYYALAALLTGRIETGGWNDVYWYNPHTSAGVPLRTDNENMTIHTAREAFPWRGYTLAVHLIRILSSLMGLATVIFTYRIALLLFNDHRPLAAAATAVAAFTPMFIFISAAVNNDNLVILFCTLATWLLVKMAQRGTRPADALWLGTLVGLGALSKLYALGLVPLALLLLLWQGFRGRQWRQFWRHSLLFGGMVILLAGWFYVRNLILYGDLLTVNLMTGVAGSRDAPLTLPTFLAEFEGLRIAYWALFGGVNVLAHPWIYRLLDAVSLAAAAGLAGLAGFWLWKRRLPHPARANSGAIFILAGWLAIMTAGFLVWNLNLTAAQGRLFFPAIAAISCLLVLGLGGWLPPRWAHRPPAVLAAGLFLFAAASPWLYIRPAYAKPPRLTPAGIPPGITRLDYTFNGEMRLAGVEIPAAPVRATEILPVTVYWQVLKPVAANYSVFVHLYGRDGETMGQFDTYPGLGAWPTTLLSPGDVLADTYPVPLFAEVENAAPARLRVAVGLYEYDRPGFPRPPAVDAGGAPLDATFAGEAKLVPWQWPVPAPAHPLRVQFDDHIALTGYDAACAPPSGPCELTLYWAADGAPSADYQVFIQLWRGEAQVAGFDGPPVNGDYPAGYWAAGETIIDRHAISLPADLPPGEYRFRVGLYRLETGQRLAAAGPAGPLPDFAVDVPLE